MGLVVFAAAALAALQDPAEVDTVVLPPMPEQAAPLPSKAAEAPAVAPRVAVPASAAEDGARRRVGDGAVEGPSLAGFVTASVAVVGLLGGAVWLLRRYGRGARFLGGGGPIRLLGRKALGARQEVLLVEVGPRILVLGSTRERLSALGEITNPDEVAVLRADLPGRREDSQRAAFKETLREGLAGAPAAAEPKGVYASIADELADIRKTVHAWKA